MKIDEIISNYTHNIIDLNENSWKVIETSDIEEICKEYHKQQLNLCGVMFSEAELNAKLEMQKEGIRQWLIGEDYEMLAEGI